MANPATLNDLVAFVQAGVRKNAQEFKKPSDDWEQMGFIQSKKGIEILVLMNALFENHASKDALSERLARHVQESGAYRYAFLFNAHGIEVGVDDAEAMAQVERVGREELRVEQIEGAQEWLFITAGDAEIEECWSAPIEFTPQRIRKPGRWKRLDEEAGFDRLEGRFVGFNRYMR